MPGGVEFPSCPDDEEEPGEYLNTSTRDLKLVSDYTGLNFLEVLDLNCIEFKQLLVDSFIERMSESKEGRDYLEKCWILKQTSPDKMKLRRRFEHA